MSDDSNTSPRGADYDIEDIKGVKWCPRSEKVVYRIRWSTYPRHKDSWIPADQINAPNLLKKWIKDTNQLKREHGIPIPRVAKRRFPAKTADEADDKVEDKKKAERVEKEKPLDSRISRTEKAATATSKSSGFEEFIESSIDDCHVPAKVLGCTRLASGIAYLVQFEHEDPKDAHLIHSHALQVKCSDLIIDFLQSRVRIL